MKRTLEKYLSGPFWGDEQRLRDMRQDLAGLDLASTLVDEIENAYRQRSLERLERLIVIAFESPSPVMIPTLCMLLAQQRDELPNEDMVELLSEIADPSAIPCLAEALEWQSHYDEAHWQGVKAIWALHRIDTEDAWKLIEQASISGSTSNVRHRARQALLATTRPIPMPLSTEPCPAQVALWPTEGQHILANYDDDTIVVYQAYKPSIARSAVEENVFLDGGEFSFDRMSWIKPNFLWMMYRSGWGTKPNQEATLAIRITRDGFEQILRDAVASTFEASGYRDHATWKRALADSSVRLQWDPDHDPYGNRVERRALQLGLRGETLRRYADEWVRDIVDISAFVAEQRERVQAGDLDALVTPRERAYPIADEALASKLGLDRS